MQNSQTPYPLIVSERRKERCLGAAFNPFRAGLR
jgi:hypothetical protein